MTRSARVILIVATTFRAITAQDASSGDIGLLRTLSVQLVNWFDTLSQSVNHLADNEDQRKLKQSLIALNKTIYMLEESGGKLAVILQTKPLDEVAARKAVANTREATTAVGNQLHLTGLALRSQYRQGGADAEKLIADAMRRREVFLSDVDKAITDHRISDELIQGADVRLTSQRTASIALGQVIAKLP
jgi:hypothetical protein